MLTKTQKEMKEKILSWIKKGYGFISSFELMEEEMTCLTLVWKRDWGESQFRIAYQWYGTEKERIFLYELKGSLGYDILPKENQGRGSVSYLDNSIVHFIHENQTRTANKVLNKYNERFKSKELNKELGII